MDISLIITIFALVTLGSVAGLLGGLAFLVKPSWTRFLSEYSIPFAAGILLTVSITHLIPESLEGTSYAPMIILVSFLISFLFEHMFFYLHHHEHKHHTEIESSVPLVIVGDTIHNFVDGVTIAAAFLISPSLGFLVAFSTFLHEVPHEIGDFGILLSAGWSKMKVLLANFLSALATFFGAGFALMFSGNLTLNASLLAISAGLFLYLGASDFLPEPGDDPKKTGKMKIAAFFCGVVIMLAMGYLLPEIPTS